MSSRKTVSAPPPHPPTPPSAPPPPHEPPLAPTTPPAWLWPVVVALLGTLLLIAIGAGISYVVWRHPSLGTPATVVIAFITAILALVAVLVALAKR